MLRFIVGDTYIKEGEEYIVLATRKDCQGYKFTKGVDYIVSKSFYVNEIAIKEKDLVGIYPER